MPDIDQDTAKQYKQALEAIANNSGRWDHIGRDATAIAQKALGIGSPLAATNRHTDNVIDINHRPEGPDAA